MGKEVRRPELADGDFHGCSQPIATWGGIRGQQAMLQDLGFLLFSSVTPFINQAAGF